MAFFKPETNRMEQRTQATPLAQDVLGTLQRTLQQQGIGAPLSEGQAAAGSNLSDFINALQDPGRFEELAAPLQTISDRTTDRQAAELREGFTQVGGRLGSPLMRAEQRLRTENQQNFDAQLANMFQQNQDLLLRAIGGQQQSAIQNLAPFLELAQLGVLPDHVVKEPSTLGSIANIAAPVIGAFAGGLPGAAASAASSGLLGGGGGGASNPLAMGTRPEPGSIFDFGNNDFFGQFAR